MAVLRANLRVSRELTQELFGAISKIVEPNRVAYVTA